MGNCATLPHTKRSGAINWPRTAKIIHQDGRIQEFYGPIKAGHVISGHPDSFVCSMESIYVDSHLPPVPADEELQLGQIYFLMPQSKSQAPLTLHELCELAIKASAALTQLNTPDSFVISLGPQPQGCCHKIPVGNDIIGKFSPARQGTRKI